MRALDRIEEQLAARRATERSLRDADRRGDPHPVDDVFDSLTEALETEQTIWERDDGKPFWSQGPKLSGRIGRFLREVDGAFAAPTPAQYEFLSTLEGDAARALESLKTFLEVTLPAANGRLGEHGVPALAIPAVVTLQD